MERKRLFIVYNLHSSRHDAIQCEVLVAARNLPGWMVAKYEVKSADFADNAQKLKMLFMDRDLVVVAGGDGTATMVANAILESGKDITLAVLNYGNLNDFANMLSIGRTNATEQSGLAEILRDYQTKQAQQLYPLEIWVNDQHWRYAPCYMSLGLLADATNVMETEAVRERLRTGKKGPFFSLRMAAKWYLKHHRQKFLPQMTLNGAELSPQTTDYLAVNSPTLAEIMKGGNWWQDAVNFGSTTQQLGKFWQMMRFGIKSVRKGVPLENTTHDIIRFAEPSDVGIQSEGEFMCLQNVTKIEIRKATTSLKVIAK